jgi:hypothetical protein
MAAMPISICIFLLSIATKGSIGVWTSNFFGCD